VKTLNKQKIAILGSGLTAKAIALGLSDLNVDIDIIKQKSTPKAVPSNVTLSISDASLQILQNIGIKKSQKTFWPISKIILFDGIQKELVADAEFCHKKNKKNLSYIVKKDYLEKELQKKCNKFNVVKDKIVSIENDTFLKKILFQNKKSKGYNLIIATELDNLKILSNEKKINWDYSETAYTFLVKHKKIPNNSARQFFLTDGPLALLPISSTKTSIVWSVKNNSESEKIILNFNERFDFIKNISSKFLEVLDVSKKIEKFGLTFEFMRKTALFRTIFMGDITHKIHPIAGQGWNMTLRDIDILVKDLREKITKGYDIGDMNLLKDFEKKTKTSNLLFSVSIDLIRKAFRAQSPAILSLRKKGFSLASHPDVMNKIINIADKGLRI
jgi:2-octaprenyl-6-methoxyphenol hydroxylase